MAMVRRSSTDRMSSSMTSSVTGISAAGQTSSGFVSMAGMSSCLRDMQNCNFGGMASNYTPGISSNYNISSYSHRPGLSRRPPNQRPGPTASQRPGRSHSTGSLHRMSHSSRNNPNTQYSHNLISRLSDQNERRRRQDHFEMMPQSYYSQQPLKVELTEFYSRDNAKEHHTEQYDLINDNIMPNPVLRRGQNFFFAVRFDRTLDKQQDLIRLIFTFGPKPSVTKGTRVVLPLNWSGQHGSFQHSRDFQGIPSRDFQPMSGTLGSMGSMGSMGTMGTVGTMGTMGPATVGSTSGGYTMRRSSFTNEPIPVQHSPLSPHGPIDRMDRMPQHSLTRGYGSMQNIPALAHEMDRWDISIQRQDGNTITFQVHIPPNAPVGLWNCWVQTNRQGQRDNRYDYKCDEDIYILFNPWCREDPVYMDNESSRKEYVLNDHGKIWCGTYRQPKGRKWIYGQFDDVVLPACIYLLERSSLQHSEWSNPIQVVRAISSIIHANEDNDGLMVGRWDNEYKDGTAPHAWTGSVAIMERYLGDGGRPVEYGQCWVYSGLVNTFCRALGIPCRSVTNYISAHDTNRTWTIDKYFDRDGNEIPNGPDEDCFDSCWNFHVWNDVWMARPDLPQGYGGWQIIDATPQEDAESVYKCGPASVEAVRRGEVGFQYDTPFVYSEVNADMCHFQEEENSEWGFIRMFTNHYHVGRKILTKTPMRDDDEGDSDMTEITHEYKTADGGNSAEKWGVFNSCRGFTRAQQYYEFPDREREDVFFDLVDVDMVPYGQPFDVCLNIQNKSHEDRNISCVLSANSCYYTGNVASRIKRTQGDFNIRAGQREVIKFHVTPQDYMDKMVDHSLIKIHAMAFVKQTRQSWSEEDDFPLHKPRMQVQVRGNPSINQECQITFSFQNPLTTHLTDCFFTFEGPGLQRPRQIRYRDVKPGEFVSYSDKFIPRRNGDRKIVATFSSRQLDEIYGSASVNVR